MNERQCSRVAEKVKSALDGKALTEIGKETKFTVRLRKVTPHRLALSILSALGSGRIDSLADIRRAFHAITGVSVEYKPFHNQLAKEGFADFMREVAHHLLERLVVKVLEPVPDSALAPFDDIMVQDGTSMAVRDALAQRFPGRFRTVSPAAVELHTTVSLFADQPMRVTLTPDAQGEREFLPAPGSLSRKLLLADRGYEAVDYCWRVVQAGGSLIIRFTCSPNPVVRRCLVDGLEQTRLGGRKLDEVVRKLRGHSADLDVQWQRAGKPIRMRMVLLWNPKRRSYMRLATNLGREAYPSSTVRALYSLRWQIELLFKEWKSHANLHRFQTDKAPIAEGLIWGAIAAATLKRFFAHATQAVFEGLQTSTRRVAKALSHFLSRLMRALLTSRGFRTTLRQTLDYLSIEGRRAHPKRDRASGRLQTGLRHVPICL